jgi:hypothetical protein
MWPWSEREIIGLSRAHLELKGRMLGIAEEDMPKVVLPKRPDTAPLLKEIMQVEYQQKELALEKQDWWRAQEAVRLEKQTEGLQEGLTFCETGTDLGWETTTNTEGLQVLEQFQGSAVAKDSMAANRKQEARERLAKERKWIADKKERRRAREEKAKARKGKGKVVKEDSEQPSRPMWYNSFFLDFKAIMR